MQTGPDVVWRGASADVAAKGQLRYAPVALAAALAALLYELTAVEFIRQPSFQFVYLVVFPTLAIAVGLITYHFTGRNLFRACVAGVSCAFVLEMSAAVVVGVAGAV
jgi:hypothetical protein